MENQGCPMPTSKQLTPAPGAAPLVSETAPPEAEIGRPEVITLPEPTMVLRSQSWEWDSRSMPPRMVVCAEVAHILRPVRNQK